MRVPPDVSAGGARSWTDAEASASRLAHLLSEESGGRQQAAHRCHETDKRNCFVKRVWLSNGSSSGGAVNGELRLLALGESGTLASRRAC